MADDADATAFILPLDRQAAIEDEIGDLRHRLVIAVGPDGAGDFTSYLGAEPIGTVEVDPDDLLALCYTSGTTGRPKGAMLSHANVFASTALTATIHVRTLGEKVLTMLPLPHVYGNVVMNAALLTGMELVIGARFDAGETLEAIERLRPTLFEGVPTMYYQMLAHPRAAATDFGSLTRCTVGGQTMPTVSIAEVVERFGCPLCELWGMTEVAGPAASHSPYWAPRHGSIGLAFPSVEFRIADLSDPDRDMPDGEAGEVRVRGPLVTRGYWRNSAATAAAIDKQGWFATGDIGVRTADGYLTIVDRLKDLIITGGYNIYPAELEQVLAMHPAVSMVAVAGVPDEEKGELAKAFVVLRPGARCEAAELLDHCRQHLARYKVPRGIAFVDDLPKTSTGKIMRRKVRDMAAAPTRLPERIER
jgi:long-chain acyl-CoA synthetase